MQRFRRIVAGLATTEGKLKAVLVVMGLLVLITVVSTATFAALGTPVFCQSCHEMRPEYVTWKAGDHSKLACVACHTERSNPKYAIQAFVKEAYVHFTGRVNLPIELNKEFSDSICEGCHSPNRVPTPRGDIIIPHKVHKDNDVPCVKCHSSIMHASVSEGGFTARKGLDNWTDPVGKAYMRPDFQKYSMRDCINCHNEHEGAPTYTKCTACHRKLTKPDSHQEGKFLTEHGKEALKDIQQCDRCHKLTVRSSDVNTTIDAPAALYARQNAFCSGCHMDKGKKPPSHGVDWRQAHRRPAAQNEQACLVCHEEGRPGKNSFATKTSCSQCHSGESHATAYLVHKKYPLTKGTFKISTTCRTCHGNTCGQCHYLPWAPANAS